MLQVKEFDISNNFEMCCACTTKSLKLTQEEAELTIGTCCGLRTLNVKREYGEMGFVEKKKDCICCFKVATDISPMAGQSDMAPGCPCTNRAQVNKLVQELRYRMSIRWQVGQIKKQEQLLRMIADVEDNLNLVATGRGFQFQPSQQEMQDKFGQDLPKFGEVTQLIETSETKHWDVTSKIDSCLNCCFTCGIAGWTTEMMELEEDVMYIKTKNRIDDSDMKIPYTEMDSVDVSKVCCCCFSVNEQSPGYGCDKAKVDLIAVDLQERKHKRGNIAHLKQLRSMQATAVKMDMMTHAWLKHEKIQYPPTPEVMEKTFPTQKPWILTHDSKPHFEAHKDFETKTYTVTNYPSCICSLLCCPCAGCTKETLELGPEEMLLVKENWCNRVQSRTPYGNLGAVETETACCCCSELPEIAKPGCGCSADLVKEIGDELQERKVKKGNIAQMKQQENIILEVLNTGAKLDVIMHQHGIQYPPSSQLMAAIFCEAAPKPQVMGLDT